MKQLEEKEKKKKKENSPESMEQKKMLLTAYQVKDGDTLESIAAKDEVYGDPAKWKLLYEGNRSQIRDPKILHPGQILHIPRGEAGQEKKE
jgi:nucleoid-associated protein YgaU